MRLPWRRATLMDHIYEDHRNRIRKGLNALGARMDKRMSISQFDKVFHGMNEDPYNKELFDKVYNTAKRFDIDFIVSSTHGEFNPGAYDRSKGLLSLSPEIALEENHISGAQTVLHELLHSVTTYAIKGAKEGGMTQEVRDAVRELERIYSEVASDSFFSADYGRTNMAEMVAELANPTFRGHLAQRSDASGATYLDVVEKAVDTILENPSQRAWNNFRDYGRTGKYEIGGTDMFIGKRARAEYERLLEKKRPDMPKELRQDALDYLHSLEDTKENNRKVKIAVKWLGSSDVTLPNDAALINRAIALADRAKVDPMRYDSPREVLSALADVKEKEKPINPDDVPQLSNKKDYGNGLVVYDVEDTKAGQAAMRRIIDTHYGKDKNPWCLLQGDGEGNLTENSWEYWNTYNGIPKQVAFKDGKLLAFRGTNVRTESDKAYADGEATWWDRQDNNHVGLPSKVDFGDGRKGVREYNPSSGEWGEAMNIERGNQENGKYESWWREGAPREVSEWKDGKAVGVHRWWNPEGKLQTEMTFGENGIRHTVDYHDNGAPKRIYDWDIEHNHVVGEKRIFYSDGKPFEETSYNENGKMRRYRTWHPNGYPEQEIHYDEDGEKHGLEEWRSDSGQLLQRVEYEHGGMLLRENFNRDGSLSLRDEAVGSDLFKETWQNDYSKPGSYKYVRKWRGDTRRWHVGADGVAREIVDGEPVGEVVRGVERGRERDQLAPEQWNGGLLFRGDDNKALGADEVKALADEWSRGSDKRANTIVVNRDRIGDERLLAEINDGLKTPLTWDRLSKLMEEAGAVYIKGSGKMIIFADGKTGGRLRRDIRHEEIHHQMDIHPDTETAEPKLVMEIAQAYPYPASVVKQAYPNVSTAELADEVVTHITNDAVEKGYIDKLLAVLTPEIREYLTDILKATDYGHFNRQGTGSLAFAEERSSVSEKDGRGDSKKFGALRGERGETQRDESRHGELGEKGSGTAGKDVRKEADGQRGIAAIRQAAERMAERLNTTMTMVGSVEEMRSLDVYKRANERARAQMEAKPGFFDPRTGQIVINLSRCRDAADAAATVLHETAGHYGLRELVAMAAPQAPRGGGMTLEEKNELTAAERGFISRVKAWAKRLLMDVFGIDHLPKWINLTDAELRYMVKRSRLNLENRGLKGDPIHVAQDITLREDLGLDDDGPDDDGGGGGLLWRNGDPGDRDRVKVRDEYESQLRRGVWQSREALQDSMLSMKTAMLETLKAEGNAVEKIEDVASWENPYMGENALSSVNKAERDAMRQELMMPMLEEVSKLARDKRERGELTNYMMAKHGLERQAYMAHREAERMFARYQAQHPKGHKTLADFEAITSKRDFAGLTGLTGYEDVADAIVEAESIVNTYEGHLDTTALWDSIKRLNEAILDKAHEGGLMDKATRDKIKGMYDHYIPLRGFDDTTSAEVYAYINEDSPVFNAPMKLAQGRKSKADDPLANMESMMESVISQANRNSMVKQRLLNFVMNHRSDLANISELWYRYDDVNNEWVSQMPDNISPTDTPAEVEQKMRDFEQKMEQLRQADPDRWRKSSDAKMDRENDKLSGRNNAPRIPYRVVTNDQQRQHMVVVKRNGVDYLITVNGNPRLAQAANGLTNPDSATGLAGGISRGVSKFNRFLSGVYTTLSPGFIVSNWIRDMVYSNTMAWVREDAKYGANFNLNYVKYNPINTGRLFNKMRKGELDQNNRVEWLFKEFIDHGGETGYTVLRDLDAHKSSIEKEFRNLQRKAYNPKKVWDLLAEQFMLANRAVECSARFAAYVTSREAGRDATRSAWDAKEVSVNFNKKGAGSRFVGANGQTLLGNTAAVTSGIGRAGYVFWNAALQGTTNLGRQFKHHPLKASALLAANFALGVAMASVNRIIGALFGDDDDEKYYDLPEYVRRSNIVMRAGDGFVTVPLPIEYRAIYGLGEMLTSMMDGHAPENPSLELASQLSQVMPVDVLEGGGGWTPLVPSAAKPIAETFITKRDWTGMPLYRDNDFNKTMPGWTKAYKRSNPHLVGLAQAMSDATGGDKAIPGAIDINPAQVENLLSGYFGGLFTTMNQLTMMGAEVFAGRDFQASDWLMLNRVFKQPGEQTDSRSLNQEYWKLRDSLANVGVQLRVYRKEMLAGDEEYERKFNDLVGSVEYRKYELCQAYSQWINELREEAENEGNEVEKREEAKALIVELKRELIERCKEIDAEGKVKE